MFIYRNTTNPIILVPYSSNDERFIYKLQLYQQQKGFHPIISSMGQ